MQVAPLGARCSWCNAADWSRGELAEMPAVPGALFHDRAPIVPDAPLLNINTGGSALPAGTHRYVVAFVWGLGPIESPVSDESVVVTAAFPHRTVGVTLPIGPPGVSARLIYRSVTNDVAGSERLLTTIADNVATFYGDDLPDTVLDGAALPAAALNPGGRLSLFPGPCRTSAAAAGAAP